MRTKNAVYLNADRTKAVPAGHEDAAHLLVGVNGEVSEADAKKYGITENGAEGQKKTEPLKQFAHMVTDATPDGVNTSPDSPQAKDALAEEGKSSVTITKEEKPSAIGLAPAKKRG
jgi:hypothetical protein